MGNRLANCYGESEEDPDEEWKKQNEQMAKNPVYKLINLKSGGTLFDVYQKNDESAFREAVRGQLPQFLYHPQGHPREIPNNSRDKQSGNHWACWDLDKRGGVGEHILHICYLNNTEAHKNIAKILINMYPDLGMDIYEGKEYYGENCLHIAIVNGDFESVKFLVENGAVLDQRASGRFFLPEDQKDTILSRKNTNYFGYAYYGEYALHFAASFGHIEIYNYLMDWDHNGKVDPNNQDSFGNTVLHMVVIHNRLEMYQNVMRCKVAPDPTIKNEAGLTAMALACKLGRGQLFQAMMEYTSNTLWRFGTLQCVTYPLEDVDSITANGELNLDSALSVIVFGSDDEEHIEMVEGGVVYLLLQEKWQVFAKRQFITRFILAFLHLIVLSVAVYLRPSGDLLSGTDTKDIVRYIAELILLIDCAIYLVFEIFNIKAAKLGYFKSLLYVPAKTLFLVSCFLFILCLPCRLASFRLVEDSLALVAVPMAWGYIMFFYRGLETLGPFVTMIYKMTMGDLFPFSIIWITMLSAFSPAFYYPFKGLGDQVETFDTPYGTWMSLYHMTFGEFEALISGEDDEIDKSRIPALTKILLCLFMILVPILLLNMLIAMMSNTYQIIKVKARREWQRQWAKIIMVLERSCSKKELMKYQEGYSIPGTKPQYQTRPMQNGSVSDMESESGTKKSYASISEALQGDTGEDIETCPCLMIVKPTFKGQSLTNSEDPTSVRRSLQDWKVISRNARHRLAEQGTKGSKAANIKKSRSPMSSRPGSSATRSGFLV